MECKINYRDVLDPQWQGMIVKNEADDLFSIRNAVLVTGHLATLVDDGFEEYPLPNQPCLILWRKEQDRGKLAEGSEGERKETLGKLCGRKMGSHDATVDAEGRRVGGQNAIKLCMLVVCMRWRRFMEFHTPKSSTR
jgi:hypothetical protein